MAGKRTRKPIEPSGDGSSGRTIRRVGVVLVTLVAVAGLVWIVAWLGGEARRGIGPRDRYLVRFADVDCNPPPGFDRSSFLSEVRYVSTFPESFQSLDPDLTAKLTTAFSAHPWVAGVETVSVDPGGTVRVKLRYRTPVLAVRTEGGGVRVVDGGRVLLPLPTGAADLPELVTPIPAPTASAGQEWVDEVVKRAMELIETHHPRKLEKTTSGWRLTMPDGKTLVVER